MTEAEPLVTCQWLNDKINGKADENIVILETTWYPKEKCKDFFIKEHIPKARFFDMWAGVYPKPTLSRPFPVLNQFIAELERVGVSKSTHMVLYDRGEMKYASRMWLQCKEIGLTNVSVLDGGIANWKLEDYSTESGEVINGEKGEITAKREQEVFCSFERMCDEIRTGSKQIVDTRDVDYFLGHKKEPSSSTIRAFREANMQPPATLMRGHITKSKNLFYDDLLNEKTCCFKTSEELLQIFNQANVDAESPTIALCYNGQTACMVPLAATRLSVNPDNYLIYTGSWTEFGQRARASDIDVGKAS